ARARIARAGAGFLLARGARLTLRVVRAAAVGERLEGVPRAIEVLRARRPVKRVGRGLLADERGDAAGGGVAVAAEGDARDVRAGVHRRQVDPGRRVGTLDADVHEHAGDLRILRVLRPDPDDQGREPGIVPRGVVLRHLRQVEAVEHAIVAGADVRADGD